MTKLVKIGGGIAIIAILGIGGVIMFGKPLASDIESKPATAPAESVPTTSSSVQVETPSAADQDTNATSETSIDEDLQEIDAQTAHLNDDASSVDQGLIDAAAPAVQ